MPSLNKKLAVATAAMLGAGGVFPSLAQAMPAQSLTDVPSRYHALLLASADQDDWTAWGGAMRGSAALRHSDGAHNDWRGQRRQTFCPRRKCHNAR
jgi:hypothetical protein